jgi:hypothetical protein
VALLGSAIPQIAKETAKRTAITAFFAILPIVPIEETLASFMIIPLYIV